MTEAQKRALKKHRLRLKNQGLTRVELVASEADAVLLRQLAAVFRDYPTKAAEMRKHLRSHIGATTSPTDSPLKGLLIGPFSKQEQ